MSVRIEPDRSPLFSVIWCGRNCLQSVGETLAALRAQSLGDFELVVEDCGSSDGTLEALKSAAMSDDRIRVNTRFSMQPGEALLRALRRCRGTYVAICSSDGSFLPHALETAASKLDELPSVGAVCTQGFLVNAKGNTIDEVNLVTLLFGINRPFLPAAFYRRQALVAVGIHRDGWLLNALELELCCRLATDFGLVSVSDQLFGCRDSIRQVVGHTRSIEATIDDHLQLVSHIFSRDGFFGGANEHLALECKANQLSILWEQFRALGHSDIEYKIIPQQSAVVRGLHLQLQIDHRTLRSLHRLFCNRSHNLGILAAPLQKLFAWSSCRKEREPIKIGYTVWNFPLFGRWLKRKIIRLTLPTYEFHSAAPSRDAMYADIYALLGARYEARGQIDLALSMWDRARPPDDVDLDSLACQAMLKSSAATDASLALRQKAWVRRHLGRRPLVSPAPLHSTRSKVRIGYFCSFIDSDTMRNMMGNVIAAHDRNRFEVFGYSPQPAPEGIERAFDRWRLVRAPSDKDHTSRLKGYTDEQFAELVKSDEIDVFVELSGFSPGNRFGAMSLRCAPVQVSFMNHTGTSQVPNVDYILSDEICTPSTAVSQAHYSETIYRLPGCFFCFDYSTSAEPDVTEPPTLTSRQITFGCFGTGGKISDEIVGLWARLLHSVPLSILHLQNPNLSMPDDRRFMASRFLCHGISSDRLILEGGVDRRTLLQIYRGIDISLDTWPYCGGNTIAESKWHGVPVVTYRGNRFSSAYGASLVTAAGCSDLVANTPDEYVDIAVRLANDPARLVSLRRNLRRMSLDHGLGNSTLFAGRLENAYLDMLGRLAP